MLSASRMIRVAVLGSTGSVGRQALEVIEAQEELCPVAIGGYTNWELLRRQGVRYHVQTLLCAQDAEIAPIEGMECLCGVHAFDDYALHGDYDVLVVACASVAGLVPTLHALRRGKRVALANKETLVVGAHLVREALAFGGELLPIDSEHCAIHQCLQGADRASVAQLILTASGGALRDVSLDRLEMATPAEVLRHPNWSMGPKITVDCATMYNKGFEVLEAMALFDLPCKAVTAVLHRQSVVHSMVRFVDNSCLAQMAVGDMRLPIQYALLYPRRVPSLVAAPDLSKPLTFEDIDRARYPGYYLAREIADDMPRRVVMVAADEVAVEAFLEGHIPYGDIHRIVEKAVENGCGDVSDATHVLSLYHLARRFTSLRIKMK